MALTHGQCIARVQRLVGSVEGPQAKAIDRTYVSGLLHQNRRELLPMFPQGWHTNDTYKSLELVMPRLQGTYPWPTIAMMTGFLDLAGGIPNVKPVLGEAPPVSRMFYDEGQFQATVNQITNDSLGEFLFLQHGLSLAYWPLPRVNRAVRVSYVAAPLDVTGNYDAIFCFPERAYNILFAKTAADCKAFDDNTAAMQALDARYEREWARAMALQGAIAANDPAKTKQG
jgi:hypothetical protein